MLLINQPLLPDIQGTQDDDRASSASRSCQLSQLLTAKEQLYFRLQSSQQIFVFYFSLNCFVGVITAPIAYYIEALLIILANTAECFVLVEKACYSFLTTGKPLHDMEYARMNDCHCVLNQHCLEMQLIYEKKVDNLLIVVII